ncbi:MAG: SMC-Scp complex subunit ScpB [Ruminococcus sp.]|nr:SMC-Scp complex subunit ScpB [Ruminococcus sp.]
MSEINIKSAIEAILFASGSSVELSRIASALEISEKKAEEQISVLIDDYNSEQRGITIIKLKNAYQMVSVKEYAPQIRTIMDLRRNSPLSQAALEVLAVVAYNQPVTKAFVEQVRGVDCSGVIGSLTLKGLVEEKGRLELPGRPLLYGTTENFLRCFNISSLDQLPALPENDEKDSDDNSDSALESTNENELTLEDNKDIENNLEEQQ